MLPIRTPERGSRDVVDDRDGGDHVVAVERRGGEGGGGISAVPDLNHGGSGLRVRELRL